MYGPYIQDQKSCQKAEGILFERQSVRFRIVWKTRRTRTIGMTCDILLVLCGTGGYRSSTSLLAVLGRSHREYR